MHLATIKTRAGDVLYPNRPTLKPVDISERQRLRARAHAVIRRDRLNHQRQQTLAYIESNNRHD